MSDMRYEPGNWGDVLKGIWAQAIVESLCAASAATDPAPVTLRVLDSFAGHPVYALTPGTSARLRELAPDHPYAQAQAAYAARDLLASAATIMRDSLLCAAPSSPPVAVFDIESHKRDHYANTAGFTVANLADGFDALDPETAASFDLLVLDPYEFIWRYEEALPPLLAAARTRHVLIYLFDKSPSSGGYRRNATNFLADLDRARPDGDYLLGRAPADGFLPLIYHEMLFLPASNRMLADANLRHQMSTLAAHLRRATQDLAEHIEKHHQHLRGRL